jgi:hypothetical protein
MTPRPATPRERALLRRALARYGRGGHVPNGIVKRRGARPSDFDPTQLAIGIKVELEHTNRPEVALEIAMAHLLERADYYVLLERMEKAPPARDGGRDPKGVTSPLIAAVRQYGGRVKYEDQHKRTTPDPGRPRWGAYVVGVFGHDGYGEGHTKEGAVRAAVASLPPHVASHFVGRDHTRRRR